MTSIEHDNDAGRAGASAGCGRTGTGDLDERVTVTCAVIGLTNFGERPMPSTRLAEVLGRPVSEAAARRLKDGSTPTQAAGSSPSGRRGT